jgi:mono/diheme cytochrome c family protein
LRADLYIVSMTRTIFFVLLLAGTILHTHCQYNQFREGELLYNRHCANCHGDAGLGLGLLIPPIAQSDYMALHRDRLPCIIRKGLADTIMVNGQQYDAQPMPANNQLNAIQMTNLLNFIGQNWGNNLPEWQLQDVESALRSCN